MSTPYMNLTLPTPSVTPSPTWATSLNTAITSIDSHNHTTGQGVQIPTSGININLDLPFNSFNATQLRSSRFVSQGSPLALGSDLNCVYVSGGNLYYNNGSGQQVQITSGSGLSASSVGGISGLTSTTASASYNSGTQTFTWWQNTNKAAIMDVGSVVIHDPSGTSTNGITLLSPVGLSAAYSLTLPTALPGQTSLLTLSATGVLASSSGLITDATSNLTHSGSSWVVGTSDAQSLILKTNATNRWQIDSSGVLTNLSTGTLAMNAQKITGVADPSAAQDAATKNYADTHQYARSQMPTVGQQISSSSGTFSGTAGSLTDVTNLTVTITTTGRPVVIALVSDSSGGSAYWWLQLSVTGGAAAGGVLVLKRGSTNVAQIEATNGNNNTTQAIEYQPPGMLLLDTPAAGTYTYKIQYQAFTNTTVGVNKMVLVAYEL